ncbi:MAG: UDP-N-acetylmuramate dehydrogenase, partial [Bdellovibrionales bacterium]|nr:UDP-N-acetylmuramate dehydrogenase [Bdellovibrionales bacterium]
KLKIWVISGGSNVLIQDGVVEGLVISLHELKGIEKVQTGEKVLITCLAGTPKSEVAKIFIQNRLPPAVFLTGIPGDMGSGVVMNAGIGENRVPREFCEIVEDIEVLRIDEATGQFSEVKILGRDIKWEYRHSSDWQPGIITRVTVGWSHQADMNVPNDVRAQTKKRITSQPLDLPNCGSVFRNPVGHKSAQLIESCDLKGFRIGGASVSKKHANFIVNDQGATALDIHRVIEHVRATVLEKTGVELKTEVVYIGDWRLT